MTDLVLLNDMLLEYLPSFAIKNPTISEVYNIQYYGGGMGIATHFTIYPFNLRKSIGLVKLSKAAGYYVNIQSWNEIDGIINKKIILKDILTDIDSNFFHISELQINRKDIFIVVNNIENNLIFGYKRCFINSFLNLRKDIMKEIKDYKFYTLKVNNYLFCLKLF